MKFKSEGKYIHNLKIKFCLKIFNLYGVLVFQDTPEEKAMASRVVDFLMKNIYHETKQVFKSNLDLLKTTLQCWKDRVDIPYK